MYARTYAKKDPEGSKERKSLWASFLMKCKLSIKTKYNTSHGK